MELTQEQLACVIQRAKSPVLLANIENICIKYPGCLDRLCALDSLLQNLESRRNILMGRFSDLNCKNECTELLFECSILEERIEKTEREFFRLSHKLCEEKCATNGRMVQAEPTGDESKS